MKRLLASLNRRPRGGRPTPTILVSGLPRSGTSMLMRMLEAGGLPPLTDGDREADPDNPRGYYELERVKAIEKGDIGWIDEAEGHVVKVISALLVRLPRIAGRRYVVLFQRRRIAEVLASQRRMLERRGEDVDAVSDDRMAALFATHLADVDRWIAERDDVVRLDVDYNAVLEEPAPHVAQIVDFVAREAGVTLDAAAMAAVVEPSLYRNRAQAGDAGAKPGDAGAQR